MNIAIPYDTSTLAIDVPDHAMVYRTTYPSPPAPASALVAEALNSPAQSLPLRQALGLRREGRVVVVVSDITRPIPYRAFLRVLVDEIESAGVCREDILIIVATGMHRPSTQEERAYMFGGIAEEYRIEDHDAGGELKEVAGLSLSGRPVSLNRSFVDAGFRIVTGLVEPHFMAGFSGGRKAVCPGLASLDTIQAFHGYDFLSSPKAANARLEGNPCHEESLSVARLAGVDYSLNVVLDGSRRIVAAYAGDIEAAHLMACAYVKRHACPMVREEADAVITGCGGYPLDATFYQCVKGMVAAVPAVKQGGMIIAAGGCRERMGSPEYRDVMSRHAHDFRGFLRHIRTSKRVEKDQWEFQMQIRALDRVGTEGLVFFSSGLDEEEAGHCSARAVCSDAGSIARSLQDMVNRIAREGGSIAVIPEGPYCTPVRAE